MDTHHLRTILWLRWRLKRNQWSRAGTINTVISIAIAICIVVIGIGGSALGIWAGLFKLAKAPPQALLLVWDLLSCAFLFLWMIGILAEIQRSESIDLGRLLHLPISVRQVFVINYLVSHLTLSIILLVPGMIGLCVGLILGRSIEMSLLLLPLTGLIFAVTAWTYCLRGWLVALMSNPRKRRTVIAVTTFIFVLIAQLPNALNIMGHSRHARSTSSRPTITHTSPAGSQPHMSMHPAMPKALRIAHQTVPFLWVGQAAGDLALGRPWSVLWRAAVLFVLGGLGLSRAYRTTLGFYLGQTDKRPIRLKTPEAPTAPPASHRLLVERSLPWLPEDAATLTLASLRSMTRAPEIKMQLATQVLILMIFGAMALVKHTGTLPNQAKPFLASGAVIFTFFSLSQLMFNQFGFDRNGFRSYLLWPTPRHHLLLGKNLSFLPFALTVGLVFLGISALTGALPVLFMVCGLVQLSAAFLLVSMMANITSILIPYRIGHGSLKPTKRRPMTTLFLVLSGLCFPLILSPVLLVPCAGYFLDKVGWIAPQLSIPLLSSMLLGLCLWGYKGTLAPLGRLLQRRERHILETVTHEVE